ncbi:lysozyme [Pleurocapsa sp. FMAR1]|uniref:lysozyme n=1 Tax=Pleurocapsa sp. FMAR1 TaxID=3040204 RepID=UPI0029C736F3|nr:lysozyme [Pleurocapsa sp. FMAR1]
MSLSFHKARERAIQIISSKKNEDGYLDVDYLIDDEARKVLNLPSRPKDALPYVGWMVDNKDVSLAPTKTSLLGINLIKKYEGLRTNAYLCPANVWTIGYGHTKGVKQGQMISHLDAEKLLKDDLTVFEKAVVKLVSVPLGQNQFDALVSFVFNVGISAFSGSTLLKLLNQGKTSAVAEQFSRWVNAGGQRLPGLVNRRLDERDLFVKQ